MQKMLFTNTSVEDIRRILHDTADQFEQGEYLKSLSQEEMDIRREQMVENCINLSDLDDQLNEIKSSFKEKIKNLVLLNKSILQELRTKQTRVSGMLYQIKNEETGMMETYDDFGVLISTRRLRPEEKQGTIFSTLRIAANQ